MRPDQLGDYRIPSDPQLHSDGVRVAFVVARMDLEEDRYVRRIWLWDGSAARPLTSGPGDSRPRWSPDGSQLLFLRKSGEEDAKPQAAVLPVAGGEAELITDFELGVGEAEWSPAGDQIAMVASEWASDYADLEEEERKRRPRRFTRIPYRGDNLGWLGERRNHVWLIDPAGEGEARCLTPGDDDETGIAWHPDGTEIAFYSVRHATRDLDPGGQVFSVDVESGATTERTAVGTWAYAGYDRMGTMYVAGDPDPWAWPKIPPLRRLDAELTPLTENLDRNILPYSPTIAPAGPQWLDDGSALTVLEDQGRVRLIRIDKAGDVTDVLGGDRLITGASPKPDGSGLAFVATTPTDPGELYWWDGISETRLTTLNDDFRSATQLAEPSRFTIEHDGVSVEGWIYLPSGDAVVPTLLNIHGGPATQYGYGFFDEFQVYVGAGYGVVATNPRGSSGYGQEHMAAVVGRWHEEKAPDLVDLLAAVDVAAAAESRLDSANVGIMGGSYGGLMTVRIAGADQRFKSAVAERGLYTWDSFAGTSDIGPWFSKVYVGVDLFDDPMQYWHSSPLAHSQAITTPTLIIHSETDFRTPIEQAEQLFAALKRTGVETELVRFPAGEGHELSRSGSPCHRKERFDIILEWHGRFL